MAHASGTIELLTGDSPVEQKIMRSLIADFEKKYPGIHVHYAAINRDFSTVVLTHFAGGDAPDVVSVNGKFFSDWASKGLLLPLDGYLKGSSVDTSRYHPALLESVRGPRGLTYGLPLNFSTVALVTNDDMLRSAGITHAPTTWAELEADARKLTTKQGAGGGIGEHSGLCLVPTWERLLLLALQQNGGIVSKDGTTMEVDKPQTRTAINWAVHMLKSHAATTPVDAGASWCGDAFGKQKAAMALEGAWMLPPMHDQFPDVHYSVHPLPAGARKATLAYSGDLAISSTTKNPDASWLLLDYLGSPGAQEKLSETGLAVPAMTGVPYPTDLKTFEEGIDYATVWSLPPGFFNTVLITADNEMSAVLEGKQTVDGMLVAINQVGKTMLGTRPA